MNTQFISDIEIQGVTNFIHKINKNRFSEITVGLIDVLPKEELEMAITAYVEKEISKGKELKGLPEDLQMYYAMHRLERALVVSKAQNSERLSLAGKLILSKMAFKTFLEEEKENLIPLAINGYKTMGPAHIGKVLKSLLKKYNEESEKILLFVFDKTKTIEIRTNFVKQNPLGFITGTDFMIF